MKKEEPIIRRMAVTVDDVYELRRQGRLEDAYEAIRRLYAEDKDGKTSLAMFLVAVDILRARAVQQRQDEAHKILMALQRMLPRVPDKNGWAHHALDECQRLLDDTEERSAKTSVKDGRRQTGIWGEELAAAYLHDKGYVILERDWRSRHRDIDIVARDGDFLVFIEVKTRKNADYGDPAKAVDYQKRRNLRHAISHYISYRQVDNPVRFDIITIVGTPEDKNPKISHLEDVQILELERRW